MNFKFIYLLFVNPFIFLLSAQTFQNIENIIGLDGIEDNNGIAIADYDNDNDLDFFVVAKAKDGESYKAISRLFRNNNDGSYTDVTDESGFVNPFLLDEGFDNFFGLDGHKFGASWGDFNNDGYADLFLTFLGKVQLWKNRSNGDFVNISSTAGFELFNGCANTTATWFDYDNDGFLDLYVADWNYCDSNSLYKNNGDETFSNVTLETQIHSHMDYASYVPFPYDFNGDGYMDIYVTNDLSEPNNLFINSANYSFSDQAVDYGLDNEADDMGLAIGDYNNDGAFDIFITARNDNFLLSNDGANYFNDEADLLGVGNTLWSWGARFADFDLDGDEDLFVTNGFFLTQSEPNFYFRNEYPINNFSDISAELGLNSITVSVEANDFDYDNDGDLDLMVTNNDGPFLFYENKTINFDDSVAIANWFKVELEGTISNRDAIGATVSISTENTNLKRYHSGVGFLSQSLKPLHFGLDSESHILSLQINWPSGLIETYHDLSVNTTVMAVEGQGISVLDILPSQKVYGCIDPNSCSYNPDATVGDDSCVYLNSSQIFGNTTPQVLSEEVYYCESQNPNATLYWEITGGEITSGQGTSQITVDWGLEDSGMLRITDYNVYCQSLPSSLNVDLGMNDLPEHITVARLWNEVLLEAIRNDFARPTIHARNLFHSSIAMYDIWAVHNNIASPYLIGNNVHGFISGDYTEYTPDEALETAISKSISYAMFKLLSHRFANSPGAETTLQKIYFVMGELGYDTSFSSTDYQSGNAAAFGNYVAQNLINYGLQDGSRELTGHDNAYYQPLNNPLLFSGEPSSPLLNPNRWQPLAFDVFIDQSGNSTTDNVPAFLSPEWGNVNSFALTEAHKTVYQRDGNNYNVFYDPLDPPYIGQSQGNGINDLFKWGFSMVSVWQSHLDPSDEVLWDISPAAMGNIDLANLPSSFEDYSDVYNFFDGGIFNIAAHPLNPYTNQIYEPNVVKRGDYTRVLAEFWADGPDSETPPGHWFTILNDVNSHPLLEKRFQGEGPILDPLEWDVKSYFVMGAGMHDAAISAWSIKGWYDYIRPISALRYMASKGQSSDPSLDNYNSDGLPLIPNYIEIVAIDDPLASSDADNIGKIKLYTWRGHDAIQDTENEHAGVGWILAEDWYPYQRPTFVTPPFAGYVSGHSAFSRTAAELLTTITGDAYFPGGIREFTAKQNKFLVFEEGPSEDVVLQWATYRDAADQTGLSRIWGGIHPPFDDIPARFIGEQIAVNTLDNAQAYFSNTLSVANLEPRINYAPNPVESLLKLNTSVPIKSLSTYNILGTLVAQGQPNTTNFSIDMRSFKSGIYFVCLNFGKSCKTLKIIKQ